MKRILNQLFLAAALMCGAMSVTSCQGLIDAVFGEHTGSSSGSTTKPVTPEELTEEEAEKQLIAEAVALLEEAQQEGSSTTLTLTLDGEEYPFTFKMENGQFVLQTAAGTRGNVDEALAKYDVTLKTLPRTDAEKKQADEEDNFAADPEDGDDEDLFDNGPVELEEESFGEWTVEDEIAYQKWLLEQAFQPEDLMFSDVDADKLREIEQSHAEHATDDISGATPSGVKESDPILDVTVKDKTTGETVLNAQYDPATRSLTETGKFRFGCNPSLAVNEIKKTVSTATPTCSITYPDNKRVKKLYFKRDKYTSWMDLIQKYKDFGKISEYIFYRNYWLCETDGKTIVRSDSKIEASYKFCRKVNKIDFKFVNNKPHNLSVGDKFMVKIVTSPADALVTGVFGVNKNDNVSIEFVKDEENVFEISCLKAGKLKLKLFYQDYGKTFTKELKMKIQEAEQPEPEPEPEPTPEKQTGSISFTETEHSVTWSATSNNTYTQTVTKTGDGTVTYSISDNTCGATIDEASGKVIFSKAGSVKVTAEVTNTETYTYDPTKVSYTLTVNKAKGSISYAANKQTVEKLTTDGAFTNTLTKTGDGKVTYKSSKESVATVDANGQVTIKGAGEATITATVVDSDTYHYDPTTASYKLKVVKPNSTGGLEDYNKNNSTDW